jgi:hypothetical protein
MKQKFGQRTLLPALVLVATGGAAAYFLGFGFQGPGRRGVAYVFLLIAGGASFAIQQLLTPAAVREGHQIKVYQGFSSDPITFNIGDVASAELDLFHRTVCLLSTSGSTLTVSTSRFSVRALKAFLALLPVKPVQ